MGQGLGEKSRSRSSTLQVLTSKGFLIGLVILFANDFVLKSTFHNALTGKLSDVAGLFIFPLFLSALMPSCAAWIYLATTILFTVWKSPVSESVIALWNTLPLPDAGRVIDPSDLIVLPMVWLSYLYLKQFQSIAELRSTPLPLISKLSRYGLVVIAGLVFSATTCIPEKDIRVTKLERPIIYEFATSGADLIKRMRTIADDRLTIDYDRQRNVYRARVSLGVEDCGRLRADFELREWNDKFSELVLFGFYGPPDCLKDPEEKERLRAIESFLIIPLKESVRQKSREGE